MESIVLKNLVKKWGNVPVVKNINLTINPSEFFVFLGPSGCGKTTILRMIAGLEEVSAGEVFIGNKKVNDLEPRKRDIAMVFQNYGLYPHMTVRNNIAYPLKVRKIPKKHHEALVLEASKKVRMENFLDRKPRQLSGGQHQRVALARAIVRRPKIFLMDEPLSNLDAKLRITTRSEIKKLQNELKVTTIYVTHDQVEAMTMADRILLMNQGEISQVGTPYELYNHPNNTFVASFIGSPPMNLIPGEINSGNFKSNILTLGGSDIPSKVKKMVNQPVILGVRPEDVEVIDKANERKANIKAKVYNLELLGDSLLLTVKNGEKLIVFKIDKDYQANIDDDVRIRILPNKCHFFYGKTSQKIEL